MIEQRIRRLENIHIAIWLCKDMAWCSLWKTAGLLFSCPALLLQFWLTWQSRRNDEEFCHNLAVACWICANITWMVGEFYFEDKTRPLAKAFFFAGMCSIAVHYL